MKRVLRESPNSEQAPFFSLISLMPGNNTYQCARQLVIPQNNDTLTRMYCEFDDNENFKELYEMKQDPWQMKNFALKNDSATKTILQFMQVRDLEFCRNIINLLYDS